MDWAPEFGFTGQKLRQGPCFLPLLYMLRPLHNFEIYLSRRKKVTYVHMNQNKLLVLSWVSE